MKLYTKAVMSVFLMIAITASAGSAATLVWDASTGTVDGYKVYYGTSPSNPGSAVDVGNTTQLGIDALPLSQGTQYYFCVAAYNAAGESAPCAPVAYTPADTTSPLPPAGLIAE